MIAVDSSVLIAYYNGLDSQHSTALAAMRDLQDGTWGEGVLLEYVFLEVVTVLMVRRDLALAKQAAHELLAVSDLQLVPGSANFMETVQAFERQTTTRLSFTDIAIAQAAGRLCGGQVLTFDAEFRKLPQLSVFPS